MLEGLPTMLWHAYYAQNYAGIIDAGLSVASRVTVCLSPKYCILTCTDIELVHVLKAHALIKINNQHIDTHLIGIPWNARNHFLQPYTALDTLLSSIINSRCYIL